MSWLEHEYLIPVLIGNSETTKRVAKKIRKLTGISPHIFSNSFSLSLRLCCFCHTVSPMKDAFLSEYLISFADTLDGFRFPVLIVTDDYANGLIDLYRHRLECSFLIVESKDILL